MNFWTKAALGLLGFIGAVELMTMTIYVIGHYLTH